MKRVVVSAGLEGLTSADFRLLEEASRMGELHVLLWTDEAIRAAIGHEPKFPLAERQYVLEAVRYVTRLHVVGPAFDPAAAPVLAGVTPDLWVVHEAQDTPARRAAAAARGLEYRVLTRRDLAGFPEAPAAPPSGRKKVIVTGCYDRFHSGHVRFFEEVSALGDLHVALGHDANVRHLKGPGHPLVPEAERRYMVGSIRHVTQALVTSGMGWLDAEPEIERLKPELYAVNEDGDRPEKRAYCAEHGIQYVVLRRLPKPGLMRRTSTELRGF
jgi:cytidyltransferase-like protein